MPRKLFGVLDPDGKTVHVIAFSAKFCKDEFVRFAGQPNEDLDTLWADARDNGYRCVELGLGTPHRTKYLIHDLAPDPWELLMDCEEAQER